ncbi:MAG TPA: EamA family transporter, partial [Puia sp.]|nr:EamA family transporter [Puia sp.]
TITFYEMCGVAAGTMIFLPVYKTRWAEGGILHLNPLPQDWLYIALLAGVCSVYAYTVSVELMKRLSVFLIQLTLNLEPLYGIVMAVIIFGEKERMSINFYVGTSIILCAVLAYPFLKKRFSRTVMID